MKNKEYSKLVKLIIVLLATVGSVFKWLGFLPNATISEIWQVAGFAYAISLGTMDLNIVKDNFVEKKNE